MRVEREERRRKGRAGGGVYVYCKVWLNSSGWRMKETIGVAEKEEVR